MKSIPLHGVSVQAGPQNRASLATRLFSLPEAIARALRRQAAAFPAIALAEANDINGAIELLDRAAPKKH